MKECFTTHYEQSYKENRLYHPGGPHRRDIYSPNHDRRLLSNILTGCALPDIIFGTLATLLGALGSYALRSNRFLCAIPPIVSNALIIPFILTYAYHIPGGIPLFMLTVGTGELISCMGLGQILLQALLPFRRRLFDFDNME